MTTPYDEVTYPSHPFRQTHPTRLGVAAALFGLPFAPMDEARVLEIGCGEGGNLIPMALSYPRARFVGFDLAASAIAVGQDQVRRLGLGNIRLEARDILDGGRQLGEFDYIIAHGVYSWVPAEVRDGLMRVVRECLAPNGLAFVSYNAMPGCHLRLIIREMLLHHLRGKTGYQERLEAARALLQLIVDHAREDDPTTFAIKTYSRTMLARDPRVLFHDELGPVFAPLYLHEFVAHAETHALQFLAEVEGMWWREELFPSPRGQAICATVGEDPVEVQQYLDFFSARLFRQSILCRGEVQVDRKVDQRRMRGLWVSANARLADASADLDSSDPVRFELGPEAAISLDDPLLKRVLHRIGAAWPQAVAVAELPDHADVDEALLQLFAAGHVELATASAPFVSAIGERPLASPLARLQVADGQPGVTALDHTYVTFSEDLGRKFLGLLDGSRSREDLAACMAELEGRSDGAMQDKVEAHLASLAKLGLLVA